MITFHIVYREFLKFIIWQCHVNVKYGYAKTIMIHEINISKEKNFAEG